MVPDKRKGTRKARRSNRYLISITLALLASVSAPALSAANDLKDETLTAWESYVDSVRERTEASANQPAFLRLSVLPDALRRVQAGDVSVWRLAENRGSKVPRGLIHDWMGAVFIPKATIADVLAVTRDYSRYPEVYEPAVVAANELASTASDDRFSMLLMQKVLFVTAAIQGEYETRYLQVNAKRWYSVSQSTRVQAIEKFGQPDVRVLPPDHGPGYIWRLYSITKFEQRDGGVYVEIQALGLSREVPVMLRWLVDPVVEHLPRNSVHTALEQTKNAVLARINRTD